LNNKKTNRLKNKRVAFKQPFLLLANAIDSALNIAVLFMRRCEVEKRRFFLNFASLGATTIEQYWFCGLFLK